MRNINIFVIFMSFLLLNIGCDAQKSFKPQVINGEISFNGKLDKSIQSTNRIAAKLKNNHIITQGSVNEITLGENENLLYADSTQWVLTDGCKGVKIVPLSGVDSKNMESRRQDSKDSNNTESKITESVTNIPKNSKITLNRADEKIIETQGCVVAASIKDNYLAAVMGDNSIFLYDLDSKSYIFKDKGESIYAISSNVANPVFMDTLVIFPTLDGRLNTIDIKAAKSVRNIIVNTEKFLNNIIYLKVQNDELIAATQKKIYTLIKGESYNKDVELRDIYFDSHFIYVLSLNGYIYKLDKTLGIVKSVKLPYANLNGILIKDNFLYTFENSGGFLIKLNMNDFTFEAYKMGFGAYSMLRWFSKKSSIFYTNNMLFINNRILNLDEPYKIKDSKKSNNEAKKVTENKSIDSIKLQKS